MLINTVPCPQCKQPYPLTTDTVGKAVTCRCGWRFVLPAAVPVVPLEDAPAPIPVVAADELPPEDLPMVAVDPQPARLAPDYFGADSHLTPLPDTEPLPLAPEEGEPEPEPLEVELVDSPPTPFEQPPVSLLPTGDPEGPVGVAPVAAIPLE